MESLVRWKITGKRVPKHWQRAIWSRLDELLIGSPGFRGQSLALVDQEEDPHYAMGNSHVDHYINHHHIERHQILALGSLFLRMCLSTR